MFAPRGVQPSLNVAIREHDDALVLPVLGEFLHVRQRGLDVADKAERVAAYCANMNKEIDMIAHSCGLLHAREFRREHVRIVQASGQSVALNVLYPYPVAPPTEGLISV